MTESQVSVVSPTDPTAQVDLSAGRGIPPLGGVVPISASVVGAEREYPCPLRQGELASRIGVSCSYAALLCSRSASP
jgi:hypothetical protein